MERKIKVRDMRHKQKYEIDDAYLNGYAKLCGIYSTAVYNSLSRHCDFENQKCFPSIELMAKQHNVSKPSIIKGIKALEKWGIIKIDKNKDSKTKRQLPNEYLLVDKSLWKPKPRVNDVDTEYNRAESISDTEPSQSQEKSRVNDVDCKVTQVKVTQVKDLAEASSAEVQKIIDLFKPVNPSFAKLFANTTQRSAVKRMLKVHGYEKLADMINALPKVNAMEYMPKSTTPLQLEDNMGRIKAKIGEQKTKTNIGVMKV